MLPLSPSPLTIEEQNVLQPKSSFRGTPSILPNQIGPQQEEAGTEAPWPQGIQHLLLALTRVNSLLEELRLFILIAKNSLRPRDHHYLNTVETDDLYNNVIHSAMQSALCAYLAKKWNKAMRREFKAQKTDKNLLQ